MGCSILHGKHLKISGNQFPPYVYSTVKNGIEVFEGANYQIIHSASIKYNFTYELDAPKGKPTGTKLKNGTWTGLFGDVYYRKSDLAIVLAHTRDRNGLIDFTTSFGSADLIFSTAHPKAALKPEAIVYSFQHEVWLLILTTILAIIPVVYFSIREYHPKKLSIVRSCEIICKICLEQSNTLPHGLEFLAGMYLLCIIILGTGYKCNLLTAISFPLPAKIPTNFLELAESPEYKIYFDMTGIVGYNYFMKWQSPIIVNLRDRFKNNLVRNNPAKCVLNSFIEPATVCIAWHTVLNQVVGKNLTMDYGLSPIFRTQVPITRTWVTIGLQKNSIYTNAFSYISSSYYETGMITKWHSDIVKKFEISGKEWMRNQQNENDNETASYKEALLDIRNSKTKGAKPLQFKNVSVIFKVITFGLSVAAGLFCGEMSYYHLHPIIRSSPEIVQNLKGEKPWLIYMQILWGRTEDEYRGTSMQDNTGTMDFDEESHQAQLAKQERIIIDYPSPIYADYSIKESSDNDGLVLN